MAGERVKDVQENISFSKKKNTFFYFEFSFFFSHSYVLTFYACTNFSYDPALNIKGVYSKNFKFFDTYFLRHTFLLLNFKNIKIY